MADNFAMAFYVMQLRKIRSERKRKPKRARKRLDMCIYVRSAHSMCYGLGLEKEKTKIVNRKDDGYLRT